MKTFALAAAFAAFATGALAEPVTFTFETGAETGTIRLAVFDSSAAYDGGAAVASDMIRVSAGQTSVTLDLPAGDYAMRAFHDVNDDGQMNANPFGMPTEPYAFSNNAVGNMGPASWDRARFSVAGATVQTIDIR